MLMAWTTVERREDAERLASEAVARRLAACAQVDGPIRSHYLWKGRPESAEEFRICFKLLASTLEGLQAFVLDSHPYETPEWIVVQADRVSGKYLSWADAESTNRPL